MLVFLDRCVEQIRNCLTCNDNDIFDGGIKFTVNIFLNDLLVKRFKIS